MENCNKFSWNNSDILSCPASVTLMSECQLLKIWFSHPVFFHLDWYKFLKPPPAFSVLPFPRFWECLYKTTLIKLSAAILLQWYHSTPPIFLTISFSIFLTTSISRSFPVWSPTNFIINHTVKLSLHFHFWIFFWFFLIPICYCILYCIL